MAEDIDDKDLALQLLSDEDFTAEYKKALASLSYYNAAEGSWGRSSKERADARAHLSRVARIAKQRGITRPEGQWLC